MLFLVILGCSNATLCLLLFLFKNIYGIEMQVFCVMTSLRFFQAEVEKMSSQAHDKLMNKLAAARLKAEEKRAAAESKRNRQAAKTEKQAEYIRRTGRIPSSFTCCGWWRS